MYKAFTGKDRNIPIYYHYEHDKKELSLEVFVGEMEKELTQGETVIMARPKFILLEIYEKQGKATEIQIPQNLFREMTAREMYRKMWGVFGTGEYREDANYFFYWRKKKIASGEKI